MLSEKPDMFQRERTEVFLVARGFLQNALKKLHFSRKKVKNFLERDEHKRAEYGEKRESLSEKDRVYVDESGINEYLHRE